MLKSAHDHDEAKKIKLEPEKSCAHWLKRKKRFCKMTVAKGREYCGEHEPQKVAELSLNELPTDRIPCPLDPKHTIYRKSLNKHLKICNARPIDNEPWYIQRGINAGDVQQDSVDYSDLRLGDLTEQELNDIISKVNKAYSIFVEGHIINSKAHNSSLDEELSNPDYGKETRKHLLQAAAMLGILEEENQLHDETSYIEFGAGKGQLAFYLAQILRRRLDSQVILVDRMSLRHKKDNKIDNRLLVRRIRADIADFNMSGLELLRNTKRIVAISKHLCGAATDLTLRCLTRSTEPNTTTDFVIIALCCHHRCDWTSFVGKEFFRMQAISQREFAIITKMVSWAICGTGMSRERRRNMERNSLPPMEVKDISRSLSQTERESIGFKCKRIIDYARLDFLRKHGYDCNLKYYVPASVTLENVCLLAKKINRTDILTTE